MMIDPKGGRRLVPTQRRLVQKTIDVSDYANSIGESELDDKQFQDMIHDEVSKAGMFLANNYGGHAMLFNVTPLWIRDGVLLLMMVFEV